MGLKRRLDALDKFGCFGAAGKMDILRCDVHVEGDLARWVMLLNYADSLCSKCSG